MCIWRQFWLGYFMRTVNSTKMDYFLVYYNFRDHLASFFGLTCLLSITVKNLWKSTLKGSKSIAFLLKYFIKIGMSRQNAAQGRRGHIDSSPTNQCHDKLDMISIVLKKSLSKNFKINKYCNSYWQSRPPVHFPTKTVLLVRPVSLSSPWSSVINFRNPILCCFENQLPLDFTWVFI